MGLKECIFVANSLGGADKAVIRKVKSIDHAHHGGSNMKRFFFLSGIR
jgi:hypothetical protein